MKRRIPIAIGLAAALVAVPAAVFAQSGPPDPPATYWGNATGATAGQGVVAIVVNGNNSTVCGSGGVVNNAGTPVYVVDVAANSQITGCGANGRQVRFYFTPTGGAGGRLATQNGTWSGAGVTNLNLTLGNELQVRAKAGQLASDKVQQ